MAKNTHTSQGDNSISAHAGFPRGQAQKFIDTLKLDQLPANDSFYSELERRYGGGFAQWVIDGMNGKR